MEQFWWLWALGALTALVLEAGFGGSFIFVFFAFGATVTAILVATHALCAVWQAALAFFGFTALSLALLRRPLMAWGTLQPGVPDLDGLRGSAATVQTPMGPGESGHVLHRGTTWMARNEGLTPLKVNQLCLVEAAENLTLIVTAKSLEG